MEKLHLAWEKISHIDGEISCFASNLTEVLIGDVAGNVTVIDKFSFLLYPEPVLAISHVSKNIFAILQGFTSIVEIGAFYKLLNTIKIKIQGICQKFYWTKTSVFTFDLLEIYCIEEKDGEIVQVSEIPDGFIVSTLVRSIVVVREKVVQLGKKERNGWFGACELNGVIFAARPLGNLWEANSEGIVMLTTNYKIKSEKVIFGRLYPLQHCILSINKRMTGFVLLDQNKKIIIYSEESEGAMIGFSETIGKILKFYKGEICVANIISSHEHFKALLKTNVSEAVVFTLENSEIHKLEILEDLCEIIFTNEGLVSEELISNFTLLIEKLEKNMPFPRIEIVQSSAPDKLFDEFLTLTTHENKTHKKTIEKIDKRVKRYYRVCFTGQILVNWLLYVILKMNKELEKIRKFLKIARHTLDYTKYLALANEEKSKIDSISSIL